MYIRVDRPLVTAVRRLKSLGASIVNVNEESRRIVANVSASGVNELESLIREYTRAHSLEAKASCRVLSKEGLKKFLVSRGFKAFKGKGSTVFYGVLEGRLVEVEVLEDRAKIKVGSPTRSRRIAMIPPPSAFLLRIDEDPLEVLDRIIVLIKRG